MRACVHFVDKIVSVSHFVDKIVSVSVNNLHLVLSTKKQDDCFAHHVQSIPIRLDSIRYYYNAFFPIRIPLDSIRYYYNVFFP